MVVLWDMNIIQEETALLWWFSQQQQCHQQQQQQQQQKGDFGFCPNVYKAVLSNLECVQL